MKDYSQYIPSSFGFITKLEIVGDQIHVWTPESKKGEPHKYPLSELPRFQSRLENQYKLITKNRDAIKKDKMKATKKRLATIGGIICTPIVLAIVAATLFISINYTLALLIPLAIALSGVAITKYVSEKFDAEMIIYDQYIKERAAIEDLSKKDQNITEHLNQKTSNRIKTNVELQQQGTIEEIFNIDFMDKTSLQQLQKLLINYRISKSLTAKQSFVDPNEQEEIGKSRTRTKEQ